MANFKLISSLTGQRPTGTTEPQIETTTTIGGFRINTHAASLLGLTAGDKLAIVELQDEDNNSFKAIVAGQGAKLAFNNGENNSKLNFSDANSWEHLGGNTAELRVYSLSTEPIEIEDKKYFKILESNVVVKAKSAKKERSEEEKAATIAKRKETIAKNKAAKGGAVTNSASLNSANFPTPASTVTNKVEQETTTFSKTDEEDDF